MPDCTIAGMMRVEDSDMDTCRRKKKTKYKCCQLMLAVLMRPCLAKRRGYNANNALRCTKQETDLSRYKDPEEKD
jgi:hypothetical protein